MCIDMCRLVDMPCNDIALQFFWVRMNNGISSILLMEQKHEILNSSVPT